VCNFVLVTDNKPQAHSERPTDYLGKYLNFFTVITTYFINEAFKRLNFYKAYNAI